MAYLKTRVSLFLLILINGTILSPSFAEEGVTGDLIRIGGVLDLKGRSKGLGQNMKRGIEAAFKNVVVKDRHLEYVTLNDSYEPSKTVESTKELINKKVFLFAGNVGTPTAKVSLPILAEHNIPAVGFFTGAGLLRSGQSNIINYRASYIQETAAVIKNALKNGVKSTEVCAYVQNDAYGMAGIEGILSALKNTKGSQLAITALEKIKSMQGENPQRNGLAPAGVYERNGSFARPGYLSLKAWEKSQNTRCKIVITVGSYASVTEFIAYSRYKKEPWIFSAVSFTGANNFKSSLKEFNIDNGVIMTQVVPLLDSQLPIVLEAKKKLGENLGYVSLEGFIVGKLIIFGLEKIKGDITRKGFTKALLDSRFSIGQLTLDYLENNQGSDLVEIMILDNGKWIEAKKSDVWKMTQ